MLNLKFLLLAFILLIGNISFSQEIVDELDSIAKKFGTSNRFADPDYVKYYDELGVHFYNSMHINSFSIGDKISKNSVSYSVPINPAVGIGFNKYGLSLNLANDFGLVSQNSEKYGETKKLIINSSFTYKKLALGIYFNLFSGYYLKNSDEFNYYNDSVNYPQRSDIKSYSFGIANLHILNGKKFSLNSVYKLTQKQLKSAGSVVFGESFDMFIVKGDKSFIPDSLLKEFSPYLDINKSSQYNLNLSFGYAYNFVFLKHFNFNITALPTINMSISNSIAAHASFIPETQFSFLPNLTVKSGLAYVNDKIYGGLNSVFVNYWINTGNNTNMNINFLSFRFFFGYRIGSS